MVTGYFKPDSGHIQLDGEDMEVKANEQVTIPFIDHDMNILTRYSERLIASRHYDSRQ